MDHCCSCHSEISRDGSGQLGRYLKALDPANAPVDDRSLKDLLVFAERYAKLIRFYDIPESHINDGTPPDKVSWSEFFRRDVAVITASVATVDLKQIGKDYDERRASLEQHPEHDTFRDLFGPILKMAASIDDWYSLSIQDYPLFTDLNLAIQSNLKGEMQKVMAYEEGFHYVDSTHPLRLDYSRIKNQDFWGLNDGINADISIYQGTDVEERIRQAALYVDDVFNSFYGFISQLITNSESYMRFALEQYPAHQPHMALFIAFLQLFRLAQEQMNGLTGRMLDFYYRDVLHLEAKPSLPDKVHLVFELAKDVSEYDVPTSTPVNAGKDSGGKDQVYKTNTDLVVNQAKVSELKTVFVEKTTATQILADGTTKDMETIQSIYARPVANSKDGFGEKFTDPNPKWPTFGKGRPVIDTSKNLCSQLDVLGEAERKDTAQVGFAIASPQLVLQGGKRLVRVRNAGLANLFAQTLSAKNEALFNPWLSGEKGWFTIDNLLPAEAVTRIDGTTERKTRDVLKSALEIGLFHPSINDLPSCFFEDAVEGAIYFYLSIAEQPVVAFAPGLHTGYDFKTAHPVLRLMINPAIAVEEKLYKEIKIDRLSLTVKVGSINPNPAGLGTTTGLDIGYHFDGLKTLVLQTETGIVQPGKPFDPFTAYPARGKSFYIGSAEAFNKPLWRLAVNINETLQAQRGGNRIDIPFESSRDLMVSVLRNRSWEELSTEDGRDFDERHLTFNILNHSETTGGDGGNTTGRPITLDRKPIVPVTEWNPQTEKGFLQITYLGQLSNDLAERQKKAPELEIKEISVSYESLLRELDPEIDQIFHVYPFGVVETYLNPPPTVIAALNNKASKPAVSFSDLDKTKGGLLVNANNILLPQFNYLSLYARYYQRNESVAGIGTTAGNALKILSGQMSRRGKRLVTELLLGANESSAATGILPNQYTGNTQQGMLFIGLQNLKPLQGVSMLFQFAEGSAENEDDDPPPINWSYLTDNEWRPLKGENIVHDGTYGFQTTGIVKIDIPADASSNNTIITTGLTWLCASVTKDADRIPQLVDVVTQAVEATFEDNGNDPSHFDKALSANSISKLVNPVAEISKVGQPFASFNGKHKEVGKEFYTRVSERLRHKGRAITAWDYEHIVLDRFPSIYKVKCITHTDPDCLCRERVTTVATEKTFHLSYDEQGQLTPDSLSEVKKVIALLKTFTQLRAAITAFAPEGDVARALAMANRVQAEIVAGGVSTDRLSTTTANNGQPRTIDIAINDVVSKTTKTCCGPQVAPGHVLLIPIANLQNRNAANPLQPKTSRRTLLAIQDYLKTRTSPFVHVHAKNPVYEQIIVQFKVKFYSGTDKGFYLKKLNDEIVRFLTPWAFDENAEVSFNQKIYASSIINFIEERRYVDFITDFVMGVCCNECCPPVATPADTTVTGIVNDSQGKPLEKVGIIVTNGNEAPVTQESDLNGTFNLNLKQGVNTLLFSLKGYETKIITAGEKKEFPITLYKLGEALQKAHSCHEIEQSLQNNPAIEGDIVATPCTPRSILVSVPQHIIIPYEEPKRPSPCEKKAADKTSIDNRSRIEEPIAVVDSAVAPTPFREKRKTTGEEAREKLGDDEHHETTRKAHTNKPKPKRRRPK